MDPIIGIRPVEKENLPELLTISRQTFVETFAEFNTQDDMDRYTASAFSREKMLAELLNPDSRFFFAFYEDQLAGYLKINTGSAQTEKHDQTALEIERIYVLSNMKGKQIGTRLMERAFEIATCDKCSSVWLGVWENNLPAIEFYKRLGFEAFGEHIFSLGDDEQRDVLMKKNRLNN